MTNAIRIWLMAVLAVNFAFVLATASHPFVGEYADANSVMRDDGSFAIKMKPRKTVNKYDSMIDKRSGKAPMTLFQRFSEKAFGKSAEKIEFEMEIEKLLASKKSKQTRFGYKRLGDLSTLLTSDDSITYGGEIYMGKFTRMNVIFDSGSDWLVIQDRACETCNGSKYDGKNETRTSSELVERVYGSTTLKGHTYRDTVCILLNTCIFEFEYFGIHQTAGFKEPIDGILGLARPLSFYMDDEK